MLTGRRPFSGEYRESNLEDSFGRPIPEGVRAVVAKARAKDLDERYSMANEMATDLKALLSRTDDFGERERSRPLWIGVLTAFLLIVIFIGFQVMVDAGGEAGGAGGGDAGGETAGSIEGFFVVPLPGDAAELVRALLPPIRKPLPYFYEPGLQLLIGRKERLVIYGSNLWRNPQVFLGSQPASGIEILPDMEGVIAAFDKVQQPAGWQPKDKAGTVAAWVWTSEGNAKVGDVLLHKPTTPARPPAGKLEVTVISNLERIPVRSNTNGFIPLKFSFAKKPGSQEDKVSHVFLRFENAVPTQPDPLPACLEVENGIWKVEETCDFQMELRSLAVNTAVVLKIFRTKNEREDGEVVAQEELGWLITKN